MSFVSTHPTANPAVTSPEATMLAYEGVYKAFGDHLVLKNVNLQVANHEVVCLIGASGCGKSTLLRCTNLLEPIQAGKIVLNGAEITAPGVKADEIRRRVGLVFQSYNLFPHMSVLKNITLGPRRVLHISRSEAEAEAEQLLQRFGLRDKINEFPDRLSGGQQQRVAVVRALAMRPEVLLLDEITSALDPEMVGEVLDIIVELKGLGMTMMLATHQMAFARRIADRVVFLDGGAILEQGPPESFFHAPQHERTRQFLERVMSSL
ncbi:MAG: amino acid ABC transporter ATP-binding protein [Thermomicrobiales bacterium]